MCFRIASPRSDSEVEQQKIVSWLSSSGPPALDGKGDLELPLPRTAMTDMGFEPAYAVRITPRAQAGKLTVARAVEPQTRAVTEASWAVEDPFAVGIPSARLAKRTAAALQRALAGARKGRATA